LSAGDSWGGRPSGPAWLDTSWARRNGPRRGRISFGDLAADRSGSRFADVATRSDEQAITRRARLRAGFSVENVFPAIAEHAGRHADLDVEFIRGRRVARFRVVVVPGRDEAMTRLCTNLPRTPFSAPLVARLYRFRWQIELCVKEWTSYANLHKFDTANPHIAAGLIWATDPWPARSWAALSGYPLAAAGSSGGGERRDAPHPACPGQTCVILHEPPDTLGHRGPPGSSTEV